jgi:hypothetical protein
MKQMNSSNPLADLIHLTQFIDNGGQISIGQIHPIPCVAIANDDHNCLAMLKRRPNETLYQLLTRLDAAIAGALNEKLYIDEINKPR